ncbi:MAG TPA: hypothetical protein VH988_09645 [Thermoanaerobaculia bacterium]|jgi:hypothetical protein|nr:hypothetical protein [Thermoanaerobaculia bacterium]
MATVINEATLEPKAEPPGEPGAAKSGGGGDDKLAPGMQREIEKMMHRAKQRAARLFAH